jgi:hypothetical protein
MSEIGDVVDVCDEQRRWHKGLITAIHGWITAEQREKYFAEIIAEHEGWLASGEIPSWTSEEQIRANIERFQEQAVAPLVPSCINVVYVSGRDDKTDPNGRQIERLSSLQHEDAVQNMTVPGRFYRLVEK